MYNSNILGEVLLKKWKNIRDRYVRDCSLRKGKSGDGAKRKTPYVYAQQLKFLDDTIENRKTTSSLDTTENTAEDPQPSPSQESRQKWKKAKLNPVEMKLMQALEENAAKREKKEKQDENDNRLFLLSLLPAMEAIPPHLKLVTRMEILQIINKYSAYAHHYVSNQHTFPAHPHHTLQLSTQEIHQQSQSQQQQGQYVDSQSNQHQRQPLLSPNESLSSNTSIYAVEDSDISLF